jgi:hypothetical protein
MNWAKWTVCVGLALLFFGLLPAGARMKTSSHAHHSTSAYPPEAAAASEQRVLARFLKDSSNYQAKEVILMPGNLGYRPVHGWVAMIDVWARPNAQDAQEAAAEMVNMALNCPMKYRIVRAQAFVHCRSNPDATVFGMETTGDESPIITQEYSDPND